MYSAYSSAVYIRTIDLRIHQSYDRGNDQHYGIALGQRHSLKYQTFPRAGACTDKNIVPFKQGLHGMRLPLPSADREPVIDELYELGGR
jgi:hypothetical protein